jgi:hypothetical protein
MSSRSFVLDSKTLILSLLAIWSQETVGMSVTFLDTQLLIVHLLVTFKLRNKAFIVFTLEHKPLYMVICDCFHLQET